MSIEPYNRAERILSGEDLEPTTRLEYFMKEAASGGGGGGGAEKAVFNFLQDEETGDVYLDDGKTKSDIDAAFRAGKELVWQFFGVPISFANIATDSGHFNGGFFFMVAPEMDMQGAISAIDFECIAMDGAGDMTYSVCSVSATPF